MPSVYLTGSGYYLPSQRITNAELAASLDTSEAWIDSHLGIRERRRAAHDEGTADLGTRALERALARAGWEGSGVDLLVCGTSTPDTLIPAAACYIGRNLGIDPVAFDVNASCSGFTYAISVADSMLRSGRYRRAAVVAAEKYTRVVDARDRSTAVFFGDGAGAVLLQSDPPERGLEIVDVAMANMNDGADVVTIPLPGYFQQDGPRVKQYALRGFQASALEILVRNGLRSRDLRFFVAHQASYRLLQTVCDLLDIHESQHWYNVRDCGNQGAAGCATAFCQHLERCEKDLEPGDWILATTFGSGFTTASVLFRLTG